MRAKNDGQRGSDHHDHSGDEDAQRVGFVQEEIGVSEMDNSNSDR